MKYNLNKLIILNFVIIYQPFVILSACNAIGQLETNYIWGVPLKFTVFKLELVPATMP